jgi:hypothetical protein
VEPHDRPPDPIRAAALEGLRLPALADSIWAGLSRTDVVEADFPMITLRRAEAWARIQFVGGISLLRFPELAYAADCQLRGLLEYAAVVGWISGRGSPAPPGDPRCRALCIEIQDDWELTAMAGQTRPAWLPEGYVGLLRRLL